MSGMRQVSGTIRTKVWNWLHGKPEPTTFVRKLINNAFYHYSASECPPVLGTPAKEDRKRIAMWFPSDLIEILEWWCIEHEVSMISAVRGLLEDAWLEDFSDANDLGEDDEDEVGAAEGGESPLLAA